MALSWRMFRSDIHCLYEALGTWSVSVKHPLDRLIYSMNIPGKRNYLSKTLQYKSMTWKSESYYHNHCGICTVMLGEKKEWNKHCYMISNHDDVALMSFLLPFVRCSLLHWEIIWTSLLCRIQPWPRTHTTAWAESVHWHIQVRCSLNCRWLPRISNQDLSQYFSVENLLLEMPGIESRTLCMSNTWSTIVLLPFSIERFIDDFF